MRPAALLALGLLVAGCNAPTDSRPLAPYDPGSLTGGLTYRWASGSRVTIWVRADDTAGPVELPLAVRHAMTVWRAVPRFGEFTLATTTDSLDADILVFDRATPAPVLPLGCTPTVGNAAGFAYLCRDAVDSARAERFRLPDGTRTRATVLIRVDKGRVASQEAYNALVAHELGHALGIGGHSDAPADLMFPVPQVDRPSARDAATLRDVLGRRPDFLL